MWLSQDRCPYEIAQISVPIGNEAILVFLWMKLQPQTHNTPTWLVPKLSPLCLLPSLFLLLLFCFVFWLSSSPPFSSSLSPLCFSSLQSMWGFKLAKELWSWFLVSFIDQRACCLVYFKHMLNDTKDFFECQKLVWKGFTKNDV